MALGHPNGSDLKSLQLQPSLLCFLVSIYDNLKFFYLYMYLYLFLAR